MTASSTPGIPGDRYERDPEGRLLADLVVRDTSEVATVRSAHNPGCIAHGAVAARGDTIVWVGPERDLERAVALLPQGEQVSAEGRLVTPGLVDPHTHAIFAGERSAEFAARASGQPYLEILKQGGGIHSTVRATRGATDEQLEETARRRLSRMLAQGTTTVELKSGYGLSLDDELRLLRIARRLGQRGPLRVSPTLLAAHALPPEYAERRGDYIQLVVDEMIPRASAEGLADGVDVFLEQGAFSRGEAEIIGRAARKAGLAVSLHAGQFTDLGGAELAADLEARSCDHLEAISPTGIAALAGGGVTAVLLPGAVLSLGLPSPPARALLDAGVKVALGTDCNPGSSMTESLPLMMFLSVTRLGFTCEEALAAVTLEPARALGRPDLGHLSVGAKADLVIFDAPSYRTLAYHFGSPLARRVFVGGREVYRAL